MGSRTPTGPIDVPNLEHSVAELPWGALRGAFGPSDGSAGPHTNVPSALAVLRHAELYSGAPEEIEAAFTVLERHALRHRLLYPVAVTIAPFLLDFIRRSSPQSERIAELIAEYVAAADTLDEPLRDRLLNLVADAAPEVMQWLGRFDRPLAALAIYVPTLQPLYLEALAGDAVPVSTWQYAFLALLELGAAPARTVAIANALLDSDAEPLVRAAAASFLVRFGDDTPSLNTRIDAALPPAAPAALASLVTRLWAPRIERPVVAPRMLDAEVMFAGEKLVLIRAGAHQVTLPWHHANVRKGD
ncbi:MAG TPA: hypothetical protein VGM39_14905, partial [Kofleriaceae bacterium]